MTSTNPTTRPTPQNTGTRSLFLTPEDLHGIPDEVLAELSRPYRSKIRGTPYGNQNTKKEFCPQGHSLFGSNVITEEYEPGLYRRHCKRCRQNKKNRMRIIQRHNEMANRYITAWLSLVTGTIS